MSPSWPFSERLSWDFLTIWVVEMLTTAGFTAATRLAKLGSLWVSGTAMGGGFVAAVAVSPRTTPPLRRVVPKSTAPRRRRKARSKLLLIVNPRPCQNTSARALAGASIAKFGIDWRLPQHFPDEDFLRIRWGRLSALASRTVGLCITRKRRQIGKDRGRAMVGLPLSEWRDFYVTI